MRRLLLSKAASYYVRLITGMPFTDPTGGFKCFRRSTIEALDLAAVPSTGYGFQIELTHKIWRQGRRVVEIPIVFTERLRNRSKMSAGIVVEAIFTVWRLWLQNGCRRRS
jgi:dolichol-phosphate mannosyltransferase